MAWLEYCLTNIGYRFNDIVCQGRLVVLFWNVFDERCFEDVLKMEQFARVMVGESVRFLLIHVERSEDERVSGERVHEIIGYDVLCEVYILRYQDVGRVAERYQMEGLPFYLSFENGRLESMGGIFPLSVLDEWEGITG